MRNPKTEPINVRGTETRNHSDRRAMSVENGTAAELSLPHNIKFITKNKLKTNLKNYRKKSSINGACALNWIKKENMILIVKIQNL